MSGIHFQPCRRMGDIIGAGPWNLQPHRKSKCMPDFLQSNCICVYYPFIHCLTIIITGSDPCSPNNLRFDIKRAVLKASTAVVGILTHLGRFT